MLNLQKLETRRLKQNLICCYKILLGYSIINYDKFFELHVTPTRDTHTLDAYIVQVL